VLSFNITGVRVVHRHYPPESATGDATTVGVGAGAIGHHTLLRTGVNVGAGSQLAANLTVERGTHIGSGVRCSPGSHLTADTVVGDHAFIGRRAHHQRQAADLARPGPRGAADPAGLRRGLQGSVPARSCWAALERRDPDLQVLCAGTPAHIDGSPAFWDTVGTDVLGGRRARCARRPPGPWRLRSRDRRRLTQLCPPPARRRAPTRCDYSTS